MPSIDLRPRAASTANRFPRLPDLGWNDVVVVEIGLALAELVLPHVESILDADECERAARFVFGHDRRHYQVAHAALRLVLAHYLDEDPRALRFERGVHGKPRLADHFTNRLEFNLSHSAGRALIAVSRSRDVGIDIEVHRSDVDVHALVGQVLSEAEQRAFAAVPPERRRVAFFHAWARKESFVKAFGEGLTCPLASFDMSLDDECEEALLACRCLPAGGRRWTTLPLDVAAGAAAALTAVAPLRLRGRNPSVWTFA